jgi:hypothetical protein
MMADPVTITAATLLATKAVEGFGGEAGKDLWRGFGRLVELVRSKFAHDPAARAALERAQSEPDNQTRLAELTEALHSHSAQDPTFGAQLADLVDQARQDPTVGRFVTQVYGNAKVGKLVNIDTVQGDFNM